MVVSITGSSYPTQGLELQALHADISRIEALYLAVAVPALTDIGEDSLYHGSVYIMALLLRDHPFGILKA